MAKDEVVLEATEPFNEGGAGLPAGRFEFIALTLLVVIGLAFATSALAGLLCTALPGLAGGFPYAATISRMRCAFARAASTICDVAETSSDSYSVVGAGGG